MATKNQRIATYLPQSICSQFQSFKLKRDIQGDSQALIVILSEYLGEAKTMSNLSVVKSQQVSGSLAVQSMDDLARLSKMLCESRFFSDCKDAAQAGVKVLAGLELGIPAFAAMSGIHIIQGKPALGSNVMAAMIKRSGKYNYRVLEHSEAVCRIAFYENGEQIGISEFSVEDAKRMNTQHINKFPKNMLFARAISNGIKWHCPDLFLGAPVYTPEELGAEVNEDGEIINVATVPAPVKAVAEVTQETDDSILNRLVALYERTGFTSERVDKIALKLKPVIDTAYMSAIDFIKLRDAVYAAWGAEQPLAFNDPKHAWNGYKKFLLDVETEAGDQEVWEGWRLEVEQRVNAASQPKTKVEDEF